VDKAVPVPENMVSHSRWKKLQSQQKVQNNLQLLMIVAVIILQSSK